MANKSVAYMLVAVLIGVTLITAVPDQIARYATPQQMLSVGSGDGGLAELPKAENDTVELFWDEDLAWGNESMEGSAPSEPIELTSDSFIGKGEETDEEIAGVATIAEDAVAAAEAAEVARNAANGLTTLNMFVWYAVDALIAVGVYILAKRRFG
jgi:hypothetical protein